MSHLTENGLTTTIPVTGRVPKLPRIIVWVEEVAALTNPNAIHFLDSSDEECERLVEKLVEAGTLVRLDPDKQPGSVYTRTDPDDVARAEDSTFICFVDENDAGPTNNWMDPRQMKTILTKLYNGCMVGHTMYVIPFCMGHADAPSPEFGIEITNSTYVTISVKTMTQISTEVMETMERTDADFVLALHSVGMPLPPGVRDIPWPCNDIKYIVHFPEKRTIWSYGSDYGGNSLLGKKHYALQIASVMGRDEGWLTEHILVLRITSPEGKSYHLHAAFPSACGKTNLAMLEPTLPGWKVETLGNDIAWMRFGKDGGLYAIDPETRLFGMAPGTSTDTNSNATVAIEGGHSIFTNVTLTDDGDVWWEGKTKQPPEHLTDWKGRSWTPENGPEGDRPGEKAAHPNSRFCTPISQCPILSDEFYDPKGMPVNAIIFGGRRENAIPLVSWSKNWQHGVFMGATCSSEATAAAKGAIGVLRRDPMAVLPFISYYVGDYLRRWINLGECTTPDKLPKVFYASWFRRDSEGKFLWPGFGENSWVLRWIVERLEGRVEAVETPASLLPEKQDIDVEGLDISDEYLEQVLRYVPNEWAGELPHMRRWLRSLGLKVPREIRDELWHTTMSIIGDR